MNATLTTVGASQAPAVVRRLPMALQPAAAALMALQSPAREYPLPMLSSEAGQWIATAAKTMGLTRTANDGADLLTLGNTTAGMIQAAFGWLKPAELAEAFERGARGDYPLPADHTGRPAFEAFGVPLFRRWLAAYCESARWEAARALEAAEPLQGQSSVLPDHHPVAVAWRVSVIESLVQYPDRLEGPAHIGGIGAPLAGLVYEWLKNWGLFKDFRPLEVWAQWLDDARENLIHRPHSIYREEREQYRQFVEALADGRPPAGSPLEAEAQRMRRMRCVAEWLAEYADLSPVALRASLQDAAADYYQPFAPPLA